mgnify:CR=1 FL=1
MEKNQHHSLNEKLLQARLSTLIENMHEAVLVENEHRQIVLANSKFCEMFGYQAKPKELVGEDCSRAAEESSPFFKDPDTFVRRIEELLEKKETAIGDELAMVDGRYLSRDYIPVYIDRKYVGHMWKYRDITENKKMILRLRELNELKDKLFSIIAHDLKSPLSTLISLLQMVEGEELSDEDLKEFIPELRENVGYTSVLLDNLLNWSRSQLEGVSMNKQSFNLIPLINSELNMLRKQATPKSLRIIADFDQEQEVIVSADPDMISLVIRNLISNAIKFSYKDSDIELKLVKNDRYARVAVRDHGPGMSPEALNSIFKGGIKSTLGTAGEVGTGLGLKLCKDFVEKNGGELTAESQQGKGSTFGFTLPLSVI